MYPDKDALISDLMHNVCEIIVTDARGANKTLRVTLMHSELPHLTRKEMKEKVAENRADQYNMNVWAVWEKCWYTIGWDKIVSVQTVPSY